MKKLKILIVTFLFCMTSLLFFGCGFQKQSDFNKEENKQSNVESNNSKSENIKSIVITMYYENCVYDQEVIEIHSQGLYDSYNTYSLECRDDKFNTLVIVQAGIVYYRDTADDDFKVFSGDFKIRFM